MKSTVDVVIPCYNYARYLRGCVNSVLLQSELNVRVLVIDDASSDDTPLVGEELAASHSAVHFRCHEQNKGHIATYNEGLLEWSTADYVVLLSADDMLAPGSLSRAVRVMEKDRSIGLVYGRAIHFRDEGELPSVKSDRIMHACWRGTEWLQLRCRAGYNVITSPEVVVRGSIQRQVGGYNPDLPHAGDLEMWLRIAAVSNIAYIRRVPQAFYRVHSDSMMRTTFRGSFVDLRQRKAAFDSFFSHCRYSSEELSLLQNSAYRSLAREALWDACRAYDRNDQSLSHVEELEDFAFKACPQTASLPEYGALRRRRRLGPILCNRTQIFAAPALARKVHRWALKARWRRWGV